MLILEWFYPSTKIFCIIYIWMKSTAKIPSNIHTLSVLWKKKKKKRTNERMNKTKTKKTPNYFHQTFGCYIYVHSPGTIKSIFHLWSFGVHEIGLSFYCFELSSIVRNFLASINVLSVTMSVEWRAYNQSITDNLEDDKEEEYMMNQSGFNNLIDYSSEEHV